MNNKKIKEYLDTFPDDTNLAILIANPKERKLYPIVGFSVITDMGQLVFCVEIGKSENMDEEMIAACIEDEKEAGV